MKSYNISNLFANIQLMLMVNQNVATLIGGSSTITVTKNDGAVYILSMMTFQSTCLFEYTYSMCIFPLSVSKQICSDADSVAF